MNETARMTLPDFLLARIAEDEERAGRWVDIDVDGVCAANGSWTDQETSQVDEFNPARMLIECESKRWIVQRALDVIASFGDWDAAEAKAAGGRVLWTDVNRRERAHAHATLANLVLPYADHPDCRDEWRP